nr:hypothetical protein [Amylibacter sp.]
MPQPHDPTPRTSVQLVRVIWAVWAVLSVLAITAGGYTLADKITVPSSHQYAGTLTPDQDPTVIALPHDLPLDSILVEPGEQVKAGQTVALLDTAAMAARLKQIGREILVASILRECLLGTEFDPLEQEMPFGFVAESAPSQDSPFAEYDSETGILMRAALEDCRTSQEADILQQTRLQQALNLMQSQIGLVDQKLAMVLGVSKKSTHKTRVDPVVRAHASVSIALEKNQIVGRFQTLQTELQALTIDQNRNRLDRIQQLSEDVATKLTLQAMLTHYLAAPRLLAPENGIVNRIRPIMVGKSYVGDESFIELRGENVELFRAQMRIPYSDHANLRPGTKVMIRLAGFRENGPNLEGQVSGLLQGQNVLGERQILAEIELSPESQAVLADPARGVALRGQTTASTIQVETPGKTLKAFLQETAVIVLDRFRPEAVSTQKKLILQPQNSL